MSTQTLSQTQMDQLRQTLTKKQQQKLKKKEDQTRRREEFAFKIKATHDIDLDPSEFTLTALKKIFKTGEMQAKMKKATKKMTKKQLVEHLSNEHGWDTKELSKYIVGELKQAMETGELPTEEMKARKKNKKSSKKATKKSEPEPLWVAAVRKGRATMSRDAWRFRLIKNWNIETNSKGKN